MGFWKQIFAVLLVINLHRKIQRVGDAVALWVADAGGCCRVFEWFVMQESKGVGHHFDWMLSLMKSRIHQEIEVKGDKRANFTLPCCFLVLP